MRTGGYLADGRALVTQAWSPGFNSWQLAGFSPCSIIYVSQHQTYFKSRQNIYYILDVTMCANNLLLSNTARILSSLRAMREPNNSASMWPRVVLMDAYKMLQVEREPLSETSIYYLVKISVWIINFLTVKNVEIM